MKSLKTYIKESRGIYSHESIIEFLKENNSTRYVNYEDFYDTHNINDNDADILEYNFYNAIFDNYEEDIPFSHFFEYQNRLNENLLHSVEMCNQEILGKFKDIKGVDKIESPNNYRVVLTINKEFDKNDKKFNALINLYNYFIQSNDGSIVLLEARKPIEIENNFDYLYHVTTEEKWNKIKKVGLCPHKKSDFYPYRTYMFIPTNNVNYNIKSFIGLNRILKKWSNPIVLKIYMKSFHPDTDVRIKLYKDPSYNIKGAVFTMENIPSRFIEKVEL